MLLDNNLEFADATSLSTAGAATVNLGDVVDLGGVSQDVGVGEPLYLMVQVDTAVTSTGSATVTFQLVSDSRDTISTTGAATVHYASAAIPVATLVAGYNAVQVALPVGTYERYLGIQTVIGTAALSTGKVNAFLTKDQHKWAALPDGI